MSILLPPTIYGPWRKINAPRYKGESAPHMWEHADAGGGEKPSGLNQFLAL